MPAGRLARLPEWPAWRRRRMPLPARNSKATSMKRLVLESTAPFQGLPELVAFDEGLFAREGLDVAWAEREARGACHRAKGAHPPRLNQKSAFVAWGSGTSPWSK
jgi:hypothetical protein